MTKKQINDRAAALVVAVRVGTMSRDRIEDVIRTAGAILSGPKPVSQAFRDRYEAYRLAQTILAKQQPAKKGARKAKVA